MGFGRGTAVAWLIGGACVGLVVGISLQSLGRLADVLIGAALGLSGVLISGYVLPELLERQRDRRVVEALRNELLENYMACRTCRPQDRACPIETTYLDYALTLPSVASNRFLYGNLRSVRFSLEKLQNVWKLARGLLTSPEQWKQYVIDSTVTFAKVQSRILQIAVLFLEDAFHMTPRVDFEEIEATTDEIDACRDLALEPFLDAFQKARNDPRKLAELGDRMWSIYEVALENLTRIIDSGATPPPREKKAEPHQNAPGQGPEGLS